jgi:hypothetical protein
MGLCTIWGYAPYGVMHHQFLPKPLQTPTTLTMGYKPSLKAAQSEICMQEAIQALKDDPSISVCKAAKRFEVS